MTSKRIPKSIWLIGSVFLVIQYAICLNVFMMGDDYMYGTFGHMGIIQPVFSYYFTGNGRWLVNALDSLVLLFDRYLFIIVNPWLLLLLGVLLYRLLSQLTAKNEYPVLAASLILISVISVLMTCEVFYWITGAMNYLLPALLLLASMNAVIKMRSDNCSKKQILACSLVCCASCLMMEQYALMTLGWMALIWGYDWVRAGKISKKKIMVFLISALCLATIVFAPANFVRFESASEKEVSIVIKLVDLIYYDYYSVVSATLMFILAAFCAYRFCCDKKWIPALLSFVNALILLMVFDYDLFFESGKVLMLFALSSILLSLITIVPYVFSLYKRGNRIYIISMLVIGVGSQIMLLKTDLWGFRTSFAWILVYLIVLLSVLADKTDVMDYAVFACITCMAINPYIGAFGTVGLLILFMKKKTAMAVSILISVVVILGGLSDEMLGYINNSGIHKQNRIAAETADQYPEIEIQGYIDQQYGWNSPPLSEFHEKYFRSYYAIPDDVSIEYAAGE